jgi:hypothetical protein
MKHIINADHVLVAQQYSVKDASSEHRVGTSISYAGFINEYPHFCLKWVVSGIIAFLVIF